MKTIFKVFSADMVAKFVAMITTILLIRYMSDTNYAAYTIFVASTNIFNQIAISSFGKMYIVDHNSLEGKESTLLSVEMILSILIAGVFWFIQPVVRSNIYALVLLMASTCVFGYARVLYQQQCKFKVYTILEIIRVTSFLAMVVGCYYIVKTELSAISVIIFQTISLILCIPFLGKKKTKINLFQKPDFKTFFKFLLQKEQIYLFAYAALMAVLLQIDVLALKTWSTDYNVSTYSSAFKYYNMMLLLLNTVNSVLLPKISSEEDYKKIKKMYKQQDMLSFVLLAGIIVAIIIAPYILPIIDGGKYPEAIGVFRILCVSAILSFWGSPYNNLLIKEKKYFSICIRFIIGIVVAIAGNYALIPTVGVNGTAIITLTSYGIVNLSSRVHAKMIIKEKIKEAAPDTSSPYSSSKAGADLLVLAYHRTYGLPVTISRCSNNYGPFHFPEKLIPLMIANALADKSLPVYGEGINVRDWLYVEDHCKAIDLIIHKGRIGEVYNVGGHNEMRNIDIVKLICKELGKPESLIIFVTDRKGHDMRYAIDPTKIHNELGWLPETTFEDGIKKTIAWYLDNRSWWEEIISGEYQNYYEKIYGNR